MRVVEMLTLALNLACGMDVHDESDNILVEGTGNHRIFIPKVEPVDWDEDAICEAYGLQISA